MRVTHQGSPYFIAAPESGPGDIPVYDAAPNVSGLAIEADVFECEAENGKLQVLERYLVRNSSSPPRTQYNPAHGFEVVLPPDAVVDGSQAKRPTGMFTSIPLKPAGEKNHFMFDFPVQPSEGDKETEFQITYHLPYSSGKYTFKPAGADEGGRGGVSAAQEPHVQRARVPVRSAGSRICRRCWRETCSRDRS